MQQHLLDLRCVAGSRSGAKRVGRAEGEVGDRSSRSGLARSPGELALLRVISSGAQVVRPVERARIGYRNAVGAEPERDPVGIGQVEYPGDVK